MKKTVKSILSVLLVLCFLFTVLPISAGAAGSVYVEGRTLYVTVNSFASYLSSISPTTYDSIVFTDTVSSVSTTTFMNNSTVKKITFEGNVTLCDQAFSQMSNLSELIFKGEATIGQKAFYQAVKLERLIFNAKVNAGQQAFYGVGTASGVTVLPLYIPAYSEFQLNSMRESGFTSLIIMGRNVTIGAQGFRSNSKLTEIICYGDSLTVGNNAFQDCALLSKAYFGGEVKLDQQAFLNDAALTDVTFRKSVEFCPNCLSGTGITEMNVPDGSSSNSFGAFAGMRSIKTLTFEDMSPMRFYASALSGVPADVKIVVPESCKKSYKDALSTNTGNAKYVNNVVSDPDSSFVVIALNNTEAGTVKSNLGQPIPEMTSTLSVASPDNGTAYISGNMVNGDYLQINAEPAFGWYAAGVLDLMQPDSQLIPFGNGKIILPVDGNALYEVVFEEHDGNHREFWDYSMDYHWKTCRTCNELYDIGVHTFNSSGFCEYCGFTMDEKDELTDEVLSYEINTQSTGIPLWINGIQITQSNKNDVFRDGTVSYDSSTQTLTLHSASLQRNGFLNTGMGYFGISLYSGLENLNVRVYGYCGLDGRNLAAGCSGSYGIYAEGNLNVTGMDDDAVLQFMSPYTAIGASAIACEGNLDISGISLYDYNRGCYFSNRGIFAVGDLNISNSDINLTGNGIGVNYRLEYDPEPESGTMCGLGCRNVLTVTDSSIDISGYLVGICCEEQDITFDSSDVQVSDAYIGVYCNKVLLEDNHSFCISDAQYSVAVDDMIQLDDNYGYVVMLRDPVNQSDLIFMDEDSEAADNWERMDISIYRRSAVFPQEGVSEYLDETAFEFDSDSIESDCSEPVKISSHFVSDVYGEITGLKHKWIYVSPNGEEETLDNGFCESIVIDAPRAPGTCAVRCELSYLGIPVASRTVRWTVKECSKFEKGIFAGFTNQQHYFMCSCVNNVTFTQDHSYDRNGVCRECGYRRVNLQSASYTIDNVREMIIVTSPNSVTLREGDFTLSDRTCFLNVRDGGVDIIRCGTVLATYRLAPASEAIRYGDVNGDGNVDAMDAVLTRCIIGRMLNEEILGYVSYHAADYDGNTYINDNDVEMMISQGVFLR